MMYGAIGIVEAVVLGVVQGLTEFLPVSSSAHLRVVPQMLGWADPGAAYTAVIQLGSVLAVLSYFLKDIFSITKGAFAALQKKDLEDENVRLAFGILFGTIPICVLGLLLKHLIESPDGPFRSLTTIGCASIFMGILLFIADKKGSFKRDIHQLGVRDGVLVGLGQCMALIPGCSRSGSTLTVAMFLGLKRDDAARFSFLLGIPAIVLSGLLELKDMLKEGLGDAGLMSVVVGTVVATVVSYAAIAWLLKYLRNHSTIIFVGYRVLFGAVVLYMAAALH